MGPDQTVCLETERLTLREWRDSDIDPFYRMNADPQVMEFFPSTLTREETVGMVKRIRRHFRENGFGLWACELRMTPGFIGFVGLQIPRFSAPFMPCVEIGWRLAKDYWGNGYATEAAFKCLEAGFEMFELGEIVAMTAVINQRSRRVMEKLGMSYSPSDDFDHPKVPDASPLSRHVLYRIQESEFRAQLKT